jgi:formylglycine-generating enzyme required for sulfatase activity
MKKPLPSAFGLPLVLAALFFAGCPTTNSGASFVPVSGISGVPEEGMALIPLDLGGAKVVPENAAHQAISWAVKDAGGTGLTTGDIEDNKFTPASAGTLVLTASVENGAAEGVPYTKDFTLAVKANPDNPDDPDEPPKSSARDITAFGITSPVAAEGTIENTAISVFVPSGTARTQMKAELSLSPGASVSPDPAAARDYTEPVIYTVTAEDETVKRYTVTINPAGYRKTFASGKADFGLVYVPEAKDGFRASLGFTAKISKGYWMAETEITQEQWRAVMTGSDNNPAPSYYDGSPDTLYHKKEAAPGEIQDRRPVESITWFDALEFCNILSEKDGKTPAYTLSSITRNEKGSITAASVAVGWTRNGYRLPSEMEWLWAAMGATEGGETVQQNGYEKDYAGASGPAVNATAVRYLWSSLDSDSRTHEAGKKRSNELGLFDMSGNVAEWCWDLYDAALPYSGYAGSGNDYRGPSSNSIYRVNRGEGFGGDPEQGYFKLSQRRSRINSNTDRSLGFRVMCPHP